MANATTATATQANTLGWIGNKQLRRAHFTECYNRFVMAVRNGNGQENCHPTCTDCIKSKEKDGNQEIFNTSICTGVGCSEMRWCELHQNYKDFDCSLCKDFLKETCNVTTNTECEQRTKRDNTNNNNNNHQGSAST